MFALYLRQVFRRRRQGEGDGAVTECRANASSGPIKCPTDGRTDGPMMAGGTLARRGGRTDCRGGPYAEADNAFDRTLERTGR